MHNLWGAIRTRPSAAGPEEQVGDEVEQGRDGQSDHVRVVTLDPLEERGAAALYGVRAGAVAPLSGGEVPVEHAVVEPAELNPSGARGATGLSLVDHAHAAAHAF